jgi:hypothetical protein
LTLLDKGQIHGPAPQTLEQWADGLKEAPGEIHLYDAGRLYYGFELALPRRARSHLAGAVKLVFQPAEEVGSGAEGMIRGRGAGKTPVPTSFSPPTSGTNSGSVSWT